MVITDIQHGLGDQMSRYAIGKYLSLIKKDKLYIESCNISSNTRDKYYLDVFNINEPIIEQNNKDNFMCFTEKENKWEWERILKECQNYENIFLSRCCFTEEYFKEIRSLLLDNFKIISPISDRNKETLSLIDYNHSIMLHVRRGDCYTNKLHSNRALDLTEYYKKSIQYIKENIQNPYFFIFSDEPEWAKNNLNIDASHLFIDWNTTQQPYEDLRLMINCKHHIIAQSCFSWWSVWFQETPGIIIAQVSGIVQDL